MISSQSRFEALVLLLACLVITLTGFFYVAVIPSWIYAPITILLVSAALYLTRNAPITFRWKNMDMITVILCVLYVLLAMALVILAYSHRSSDVILSPFRLLPTYFIVLYALATTTLLCILARTRDVVITTLGVSAHLFISLTLAVIVYVLGYGFDPFIHQATEALLVNTGTITPKPPYYVGYYVLVLAASASTMIPYTLIDTWIVPVLAALLIPYTILRGLTGGLELQRAGIAALAIFLVPYGIMTNSTPQSLANVLLIVLIFLGLGAGTRDKIAGLPADLFLGIGAVALCAIHPLTGIPAILFVLLRLLSRVNWRGALPLGLVVALSALPLALYVAHRASLISMHFTLPDARVSFFTFPTTLFRFPLDLVYAYQALIPVLVLLLVLIGIKTWRQDISIAPLLISSIAALVGGFFITECVRFASVATTEQSLFGERLYTIAWYFLIPIAAQGVHELAHRVRAGTILQRCAGIMFCMLAITASFYLSYPRVDAYTGPGFINITATDIETVRAIESRLKGTPYVVLANQSLAAAALRELGFERQAPNIPGQFIYPIPTGGTLYPYYEQILTAIHPSTLIAEAASFAGVDTVIVVLPRYLERYPIISESVAAQASERFQVGSNDIIVFRI